MNQIGIIVTAFRKQKNMSVRAVACELGLTTEEYALMELDEIPFNGFWLGEVCTVLGVPIDHLYTRILKNQKTAARQPKVVPLNRTRRDFDAIVIS
jgi:transcriptional regulator with XRE-family HTH domain